MYLREGAVVPQITFMREAIPNESELAFFNILLDGVELFVLGNLGQRGQPIGSSIKYAVASSLCFVDGQGKATPTSSFAFDHLGISTIMLRIVCWSLAYRGTS